MFGFFKKRPTEPLKPDLATIDTCEKAAALQRAGLLGKLFMRPLEMGGEHHPLNTLFAPPWAVQRKAEIDLDVIQPLAEAGKITQYSAKAEYEGKSVIPIAIHITASGQETYRFSLNIWGSAMEREERLWDDVYAAREALYAKHFGVVDGDVQKLMNLTGTWPGGCLVQIEARGLGLWVASSFGLTNAGMPATTRPEQFAARTEPDGSVAEYRSRLVPRPPRAIPDGRAGYGYEILLFTRQKERWPLMFLNWAVQAEILQDMDLLGRVHKYGAMTIESVSIGEGDERAGDFLIAPVRQLAPAAAVLPNGSIAFLAATLITRAEMEYGVEHGGPQLLDQIMKRPQGQASD